MTDDHAGLSPALVETVAGLAAGSVATLVVHPLDIVKTRMQIHRNVPGNPPNLTTMSVIRTLTRDRRPFASLYRGLTPNLLGNASSWASFFFFKARVEDLIRSARSPGTPSTSGLSAADYFVSSAVAGALTQILTNPVWVLKTRMLSSNLGAVGAYPSMWAGARQLLRHEGWRGFYRGLGISLVGVGHGAVQFAVYEPAKRMYFARRRRKLESRQGGGASIIADETGRMSNEATVVISTGAKLFAGAVMYPYQVIRSRLQNYDAEERFGRGIRGVAIKIWREDGFRGFYRGLMPGVVRVLPATWVTFLVYENTKYYLPRWVA